MKAVILAGGLGTRMAEETQILPKPMIQIGGMPVLWHIMKLYSSAGVNDFVICCGYKGYLIKEYFANYPLHMSDVTVDMTSGEVEVLSRRSEPWRVTLVDTGDGTMTGGRLLRVKDHLDSDPFCFTYGDGLADIDIRSEIAFHRDHGRLATVAAVQPPGRYGALEMGNANAVAAFLEKPLGDGGRINGGFFVLSPRVLEFIEDDETAWEGEPLNSLAAAGQLMAFHHQGFWQAMDTPRDKRQLEELWDSGGAPWKTW